MAPGTGALPPFTARIRLPSITMVVAPRTVPAAVSIRCPQCSAVTGCGAGPSSAYAAEATPRMPPIEAQHAARAIAAPVVAGPIVAAPVRAAPVAIDFFKAISRSSLCVFQFANDSIACMSTLAPVSRSAGAALSASLWLKPPAQGMKIIEVGTTAAVLHES